MYRLSNEEKKVSIRSYGLLLHRLVQIYDDSDGDQIRRLFNDQFTVVRKRVVVKPPSEIASDSTKASPIFNRRTILRQLSQRKRIRT